MTLAAGARGGGECGEQCVIGVAATTTPVDCVYGDWTAWSDCTGNVRTRTRIIGTAAQYGGSACNDATETTPCGGAWFCGCWEGGE